MTVTNHTALSAEEFSAIQSELPDHENLQQMITWALADQAGTFCSGVVSQVVVQDEFNHDVVVPWRDGLTLVYETT